MLEEVVRESLLLFFLYFYVIMKELDSYLGRELIVECLTNEIAVFSSDCLLTVVLGFG